MRCTARAGLEIDHVRPYAKGGSSGEENLRVLCRGHNLLSAAREFGEAARIGETIEIDGVELPFRPAPVSWYRGLSAHKHCFLSGLASNLLPTLSGGMDVPGGLLGEHR